MLLQLVPCQTVGKFLCLHCKELGARFERTLHAEVVREDARDKKIFSGYCPPALEEWTAKGWVVVQKEGDREDFGMWRCAACKRLYKNSEEKVKFVDLSDDWKCPVCKVGKSSFGQIG